MPSVNCTVKWPNGEISNFYSPSTIVYQYFQKGQKLAANDFLEIANVALNAASERVRQRYGFACSSAMDTLNQIVQQSKKNEIKNQDFIEVIDIYNVD